jgi:NAD(P)-dependent dehydrogenase (short-subunit alcohol dehydrogenase family)
MGERIVFVTGGAKGIGRAIVETFVQNGYRVALTYNRSGQAARQLGRSHDRIKIFHCDINKHDQVQATARQALKLFGKIDILVNNAGAMKSSAFVKMDKRTWDDIIDTNLKSLYGFTHAFLPIMLAGRWGRIINITSVAGQQGAPGHSNYAAAKAGVIGFTKSLALEVAPCGVTVNAVAPGIISTELTRNIPPAGKQKLLQLIPEQRFGIPSDVANLTFFLCQEASSYITGQVLGINGGMYR